MLSAAFWLLAELQVPPKVAARTTHGCSLHHPRLQVPLQQLTAAGYELVLTGHSLGAGVASLLSLLLRSRLRQPTVRC